MTAHRVTWLATCACGKRSYATRRDARHAAKAAHPNGGLSEYRCDQSGEWHYGHASRLVIRGLVAR
jgi:hypothetical protein